jgi:hypothetical protein
MCHRRTDVYIEMMFFTSMVLTENIKIGGVSHNGHCMKSPNVCWIKKVRLYLKTCKIWKGALLLRYCQQQCELRCDAV